VTSRSEPVVRRAQRADLSAIVTLGRKIYRFHARLDSARFGVRRGFRATYRRWVGARLRDPRSIVLVAELRTRMVGYLVGAVEEEIPVYWQPECGEIHDLWVEPRLRRTGIAQQMTALALAHFRAHGQTQVRVQTWAGNTAAQRLFKASGFRPATLEMLIELPGGKRRRAATTAPR
jgi:ribosomal protein S18 acetylase RimI-like enzyme